MNEVVPFPKRMYDVDQLSYWALATENAALTRRGSMPDARTKALADQLADAARRLRDALQNHEDTQGLPL